MAIIKERDYFYDNAKFILIFLVVLGHFLEPFIGSNSIVSGIFGFIYMFHMPAFIFISGYFTKKDMTKEVRLRLFIDYFVLFVLVQITFVAFTKIIGLQQYNFISVTPAYVYWYLFAMFVWSIVLKVLILAFERLNIKIEYLITLSFLLGLIVGYFDFVSWRLSLSRIIVFFPFFVLGYYFRSQNKKIGDLIQSKTIAGGIMIVGLLAAFVVKDIFNFDLLSGANSYNSVDLGIYGIFYRLLIYVVQILTSIAFFSLMSKRKNSFTSIGSKTLSIYIIHGFIIKLLVAVSYFDSISLFKVLALPLFAAMVVLLFGKVPLNLQLSKFILPVKYKKELN